MSSKSFTSSSCAQPTQSHSQTSKTKRYTQMFQTTDSDSDSDVVREFRRARATSHTERTCMGRGQLTAVSMGVSHHQNNPLSGGEPLSPPPSVVPRTTAHSQGVQSHVDDTYTLHKDPTSLSHTTHHQDTPITQRGYKSRVASIGSTGVSSSHVILARPGDVRCCVSTTRVSSGCTDTPPIQRDGHETGALVLGNPSIINSSTTGGTSRDVAMSVKSQSKPTYRVYFTDTCSRKESSTPRCHRLYTNINNVCIKKRIWLSTSQTYYINPENTFPGIPHSKTTDHDRCNNPWPRHQYHLFDLLPHPHSSINPKLLNRHLGPHVSHRQRIRAYFGSSSVS